MKALVENLINHARFISEKSNIFLPIQKWSIRIELNQIEIHVGHYSRSFLIEA